MAYRLLPCILLVLLLVGMPAAAELPREEDVVDVVAEDLFTLDNGEHQVSIPYFTNLDLDSTHSVTRAVIVLHGTLRNADDYFAHMMQAAAMADSADTCSIIIAPQFLTERDVKTHALPEEIPFWDYWGWRKGDQSLSTYSHPRPWLLSSFTVIDSLLYHLVEHNPQLERIVIIGHSAGGQMVNRHAAGNLIHTLITEGWGVPIRYITANPSSYLYFDHTRWLQGSPYLFTIPDSGSLLDCPEYNDYKFGLDNLNSYMNIDAEQLREQYRLREHVYLLGSRDNNPESVYLAQSCADMMQGIHRLQRGVLYQRHLTEIFGEQIHDLVIVPGVGHSHSGMFSSTCGQFWIFDHGLPPAHYPVADDWCETTTAPATARFCDGIAWADCNGDGLLDLYTLGRENPGQLLLNQGDGTFLEATPPPLDHDGDGGSALWVDFDGDRDLDLSVVNTTGAFLLRNDGGARFTDISTPLWSGLTENRAQAWADFDGDGDLDAYISRGGGQINMLLVNGDGQFSLSPIPILMATEPTTCASWVDYDLDGDPDLYLCVDGGSNRLLRNEAGLDFTDVTSGVTGYPHTSAGAAWGDHDNDGDLDLYLINEYGNNQLLRNDGGAQFTDVTTHILGNGGDFGNAAGWGDFNNDGRLDLYLVNGTFSSKLLGNLEGEFFDLTGYPLNRVGHSAGVADFDGDGWLDIYATREFYANAVMLNRTAEVAHWLTVELRGEATNSFGIGARIRAVAGSLTVTREIGCGASGPRNQQPASAHLGLGGAVAIDTLQIFWPETGLQQFVAVAVDRKIFISEGGEISETPVTEISSRLNLSPCYPNPFNPVTTISYDLETEGEVFLTVYDVTGRLVAELKNGDPEKAGSHSLNWSARDRLGEPLPSGIYLCRLRVGGDSDTIKLTILR